MGSPRRKRPEAKGTVTRPRYAYGQARGERRKRPEAEGIVARPRYAYGQARGERQRMAPQKNFIPQSNLVRFFHTFASVKTSKVHSRASATAAQIKEVAIDLAREDGWNKLTVRALADKMGYTPPILYQHFQSKDHLLSEIITEGFEQLYASVKAASLEAANPAEALVAAARARFNFAVRHKALHSLMFATGCPCWQREATFKGMMQAGALIKELLQAISGRNDDCHDLKTNVVALIKGYTYFATEMPDDAACQQFFPDLKPEDALAQAMERFILSIQKTNHS